MTEAGIPLVVSEADHSQRVGAPSGKTVNTRCWQTIVEQAPDAFVFADTEGVIRLWNAAAETLFGYSAAEAVG